MDLLTWHICQIIHVGCLSLVMSACVLNQSQSDWLLSDLLYFIITMCLKLKGEVEIPPILVNSIDDDYQIVLKLYLLVSNIFLKKLRVLKFVL
jgi:hypothetical protein